MPESRHSSFPAEDAAGVHRRAKRVLEQLVRSGSGRPAVVPMSPQAKRSLIERLRPVLETCRVERIPYRDIVEVLRYQAGVDVCERTVRRVLEDEPTTRNRR
jgi:hypothetical protein